MQCDRDAQFKIFLVMPFPVGMGDHHGGRATCKFPKVNRCEVHATRDDAEIAMLRLQKADPETPHIIMESVSFAAKHDVVDEWCAMDTVEWFAVNLCR